MFYVSSKCTYILYIKIDEGNILFSRKELSTFGNSLVVQWFRPHTFIAKGMGSIPVGERRSRKL